MALLEFGAGFVQDSNLPKGSERFVKSLRDALYGHIQRLPYRWHVQNPTGDIIQRCTSDVEVVRNFIAEQMVELLSTTFLIVVYMAAMFTMNVKISLFVFAFIPVIVGYSLVFYKRISKGYHEGGRGRGRAFQRRAGKHHRRACGARVWPRTRRAGEIPQEEQ